MADIIIPIVCSFIASGVRGATSFGDGITFQMLWALACAAGLQAPLDASMLRRGVLFASFMQLLTMPVTLFQARTQLPVIVGFAIPMFLCGCLFVFLGAHLLISANTDVLRLVAGLFFGIVSSIQLIKIGWQKLIARAIRRVSIDSSISGESVKTTPAQLAPSPALSSDGLSPSCAIDCVSTLTTDSSECAPAQPATNLPVFAEVLSKSDVESCVPLSCDATTAMLDSNSVEFIKTSPTNSLSVQAATSILIATPALSSIHSVLGNSNDHAHVEGDHELEHEEHPMISIASVAHSAAANPPSAASTAYCRERLARWFPKLSAKVSAPAMLVWLCVASTAGGLFAGLLGAGGPPFMAVYAYLALDKEILRGFSAVPAGFMFVRMSIYVFGDGTVFQADSWPVYVGVILAALGGVMLGTWTRRFINSEMLLQLLQVLIFGSSALMLGAAQNALIAISYAGVAALGAAVFGMGICFPSIIRRCAACCSRPVVV